MLTRKCPICEKILEYKSQSGYYTANKKNSKCRACASRDSGFISRFATKGENTGKNNAFFGKNHSPEAKSKISSSKIGSKHSEKTKEKLRRLNTGENNPMHGKTFYEIWEKKYGKKKASHLLDKKKQKNREASSGKKNPMYNKPSPNGSGNGYKGWYKGKFFRSLREVCYMIQMDNNCIDWKSAENISIPYQFHGKDRTYRPDFIINGSIIVEIKPKKLWETPSVKAKVDAAKKYCDANNLQYSLIDVQVDRSLIKKNIEQITFMEKYRKRFNDYDV